MTMTPNSPRRPAVTQAEPCHCLACLCRCYLLRSPFKNRLMLVELIYQWLTHKLARPTLASPQN